MLRGGGGVKENCIEQWFELYERDITSFLVYLTGTPDVEDYVQETFLIAMKKMPGFKGESHPKTWLISIARNMVIDQYRRNQVWNKIKRYLSEDRHALSGSEELVIKNQEQEQLYGAIRRLSPFYKEVVILRGILELSSKETGDVLKCSGNKVNVTYHRALKKLRDILEKEGFCFEGAADRTKTEEPS
jgi:RNA polymerase sigma-70 factor (ECF subfamily)